MPQTIFSPIYSNQYKIEKQIMIKYFTQMYEPDVALIMYEDKSLHIH